MDAASRCPAPAASEELTRQGFEAGVKAAVPVVLGYLPIGFAYGVLARGAGLSPVETGAMSWLVYAGSAQFIAVDMISKGLGLTAVVATTFLVNLRHLLFSAALSPRVRGKSPLALGLVAYGLTDETFSVACTTFPERGGRLSYLLGLNTVANLSWIAASVAGSAVGASVGNPARLGLDYALTAMFLCLLVFNLKSLGTYVAAATAAFGSLLLMGPAGSWSVLTAAVIGATAGVVCEWFARKSS